MMGVRWYALTSADLNTGLMAVADSMEAQAIHYSASSLESYKYTYRLSGNPKYTYLTLSYLSRGTGGESCGPGPLSQYRMPVGEEMTFRVTLVPFAKGADTEALTDTSRLWRDSRSMGAEEIDALVAGYVNTAIQELLFDASNLESVRAAYDALTENQKKYVTAYEILTALENQNEQDLLIRDLTGNGYDATAENSRVFADSTAPSGYIFSGNFLIPDEDGTVNAALSGTNEFTIAAWVNYADTNSHNVIFAKGDTQVSLKTNLGGRLEFCIYEGGWKDLTTDISAKSWVFVVAVRDSEGLKLYVNGALAAEAEYTGHVNSNGTPSGVGIDWDNRNNGRTLRGLLSGIHIYSRALDANEISTLTPETPVDDAVVAYDFSISD